METKEKCAHPSCPYGQITRRSTLVEFRPQRDTNLTLLPRSSLIQRFQRLRVF
jgi:hypothetical protein